MLAIQQVVGTIQALNVFPCVYELIVGAESGHMFVDGSIQAYDRKAREAAQKTLLRLNQLCSSFTVLYPNSSFTVKCSQTVTITERYDTYPER